MYRVRQLICCFLFLSIIGLASGCSKNKVNGIPMPRTVKYLSATTIEIPFPPYSYKFSGGTERWIIGRVGSKSNLVFDIMFNDQPEASFVLGNVGAGTHEIHGNIELDGSTYKGVCITLNKDRETGTIQFEKIS